MNTTKLSEIMSRDLITLDPNDSINRVQDIFEENKFHHLPVVDSSGNLVGILSKSDYFTICDSMTIFNTRYVAEKNKRLFQSVLVEDIMQKNVVKLKPGNSILVALGLFKDNLFHAIPIVDEGGKLVGMVTTFDLLDFAFSEPLQKTA